MSKRIAVVTGCSTGTGLQTAVTMAKAEGSPYKVFATMRNLARKGGLEKAGADVLDKTLFIRQLDVTTDESVNTFFSTLLSEEGRIDILVNNAGVVHFGIFELVPLDELRAVMETNFFGAVRTIQAVVPIMKRQGSGRIISTSTMLSVTGCPFVETYSASKAALDMFSMSLAPILRKFNVNLSVMQYGNISTEIVGKEDAMLAKIPFDKTDEKTGQMMRNFHDARNKFRDPKFGRTQTPEQAVQALMKAIEDETSKAIYQSSDMVAQAASSIQKDITGEAVVVGGMVYLGD